MFCVDKMKYITILIIIVSVLFSSCFKNNESTKDSENTDPTNQTEDAGFLKKQSFDAIDIQTTDDSFWHPLVKVKEDKALVTYAKEVVENLQVGSRLVSAIYAVLYSNGQWSTPVEVIRTNEYSAVTSPLHDAVINKEGKGGLFLKELNTEKFTFSYFNGINWTYKVTIDGLVGIRSSSLKRTSSVVIDSNGVVYIAYLKIRPDKTHFPVIVRYNENGLIDTREFSDSTFAGELLLSVNDNDEVMFLQFGGEKSITRTYKEGSWSDASNLIAGQYTIDSIFMQFNNDGTAHAASIDNVVQHFYFDGQQWSEGFNVPGSFGYVSNGHAAAYQNTFLVAYENNYDTFAGSCYYNGATWTEELKIPTGITNDPNSAAGVLASDVNVVNYTDTFIALFSVNGTLAANYYKDGWQEPQYLNDVDNPNNFWDDYSVGINDKGEVFIVGHNNWLDQATMFAAVYTFEAK